MAAIVRGTIPASEFALQDVLESAPDARFEVERIIESGDGAIMPLVWVRGADRGALVDAFDADGSVEEATLLESFDGEHLFRMTWSQHVSLLLGMITTWQATVLDAYGGDSRWQLRVLYPERDDVAATHEFCSDHGLNFEVQRVRELDGEPTGRYGLTRDQYDALVLAVDQGYYAVPQDVTLEELSEEAGVSHQALSERLRRGTEALIEDALMIGKFEE